MGKVPLEALTSLGDVVTRDSCFHQTRGRLKFHVSLCDDGGDDEEWGNTLRVAENVKRTRGAAGGQEMKFNLVKNFKWLLPRRTGADILTYSAGGCRTEMPLCLLQPTALTHQTCQWMGYMGE